jgi:adenine-specific DNA-methyltransferase
VIHGADAGGITDSVSWTGGGGFEVVHVSPRFGALDNRCGPESVRRRLAKLMDSRDSAAARKALA